MKTLARIALTIIGLLDATGAAAVDVTVAGLFPNKALVQIDGGPLQTLAVGQKSREGVVLLSVDSDSATFDIGGKRITQGIGHARGTASAVQPASVTLTADTRGHFFVDGQVNGLPVRFVVDTGATLVALPAAEAQRLSIDYRRGAKALMNTAGGVATGYNIRLDSVRVGDVTLNGVDAVVMEGIGPSQALLGMSFLNRMDMKREGDIMTLTRRY